LENKIQDLIVTTSENIVLKRFLTLKPEGGKVFSYVHNSVSSNLG
jgi:translation elongation factor EF-Ts